MMQVSFKLIEQLIGWNYTCNLAQLLSRKRQLLFADPHWLADSDLQK